MNPVTVLILCLMLGGVLGGCQDRQTSEKNGHVQPYAIGPRLTKAIPRKGNAPGTPPAPPLREDFEGAPKIRLFPRVGSFRPESGSEAVAFWRVYIDHLVRTSGPVPAPRRQSRVSWSLRSIRGLDSVGFFTPIAVEPGRRYQVRLKMKTDLPPGARAGVGVIEFDRFLWIGEQYPESIFRQHVLGIRPGVQIEGRHDWQALAFTFTAGARTHMVHLVFFREGTADRRAVYLDDIEISQHD